MEEKPNVIESPAETPHPCYFFVGSDNKPFVLDEKHAWNQLRHVGRWQRQDIRFIGGSDGTTYFKVLDEAKKKVAEIKPQIDALANEIAEYKETEKNLRVKEVLAPDDPKMVRVKEIIKDLEKKMAPLQKEYDKWARNAKNEAFNAELEVARQNPNKLPKNQDMMGDPKAIERL